MKTLLLVSPTAVVMVVEYGEEWQPSTTLGETTRLIWYRLRGFNICHTYQHRSPDRDVKFYFQCIIRAIPVVVPPVVVSSDEEVMALSDDD
ncbi:hypothetical protein HDE_07789 [Halotydeus destructor]|nr:hypothetical protein HDE_07789 [Halotydeus destructor]